MLIQWNTTPYRHSVLSSCIYQGNLILTQYGENEDKQADQCLEKINSRTYLGIYIYQQGTKKSKKITEIITEEKLGERMEKVLGISKVLITFIS